MADFLPLLVEIGTEELPPKALPDLARAFHEGIVAALAARRVQVGSGEAPAGVTAADAGGPLYTPRRLAAYLPRVAVQQPVQHVEVPGPYVNIGLDADGKVERITMKAVSPLADFSYDYHDLLFRPVEAAK